MSDTPASWQPDPTGRHDHRYWDGTRWTEHVADAGVAGIDPYDAPPAGADLGSAGPAAEAGSPAGFGAEPEAVPAADEPSTDTGADAGATADAAATASASGWALPEEEPEAAPSIGGWGAAAGSEASTSAAEAPATDEPVDAGGWGASSSASEADRGWAATTPAVDEPTSTWGTPRADEPTTTTPSAWGTPTAASPAAGAGTDATEALDAPTSAWSAPTTEGGEPGTPAPDQPASPPPADKPRSRRMLVLVLAVLAIAAIVIALVALTGDDDDGGRLTAENAPDRISAALQDDLGMSEEDADCIGRFITDEIGSERLEDVDFRQPEAPPELQDDFNEAFNGAIAECDIEVSDITGIGAEDGDSDGGDEGAVVENPDSTGTASDIGNPEEFAAMLAESYQTTLGIAPEKATCLAGRMVEAVQSGQLNEDDAYGEFFQFLEECQISLEELSPPSG